MTWVLEHAYAFSVDPDKRQEAEAPKGYILKLEDKLKIVLEDAIAGATRTPTGMAKIRFNMTDDRKNDVRDDVMRLAFGNTKAPFAAAGRLAQRLAHSMDKRSGTSLLVVAVSSHVDEKRSDRRVVMFVFPQELSYTLNPQNANEAVLETLRSFVLHSRLRKVACFEGKEIASHFLQGDVVDMQIGNDLRPAADFWVTTFLDAAFSITSIQGTKVLARGLKSAYEHADTSEGQRQVMDATTSLLASKQLKWSVASIAKKWLPVGPAADALLNAAPNPEMRDGDFLVDKDLLKKQLNYCVYKLDSGVWVQTPFKEVGASP